jgi:hypothetical protein
MSVSYSVSSIVPGARLAAPINLAPINLHSGGAELVLEGWYFGDPVYGWGSDLTDHGNWGARVYLTYINE